MEVAEAAGEVGLLWAGARAVKAGGGAARGARQGDREAGAAGEPPSVAARDQGRPCGKLPPSKRRREETR